MDWEDTLDRFMGSEQLYEKFLKKFLEDPSLEKLRAGIETGDVKSAFLYAHTLKGVTGNMGFRQSSALLAALTESLRNGQVAHLNEQFERVDEQYTRLRDWLRQMDS